ncbi:MAG TPA: amidohydrolase family protein [Longimicrobiales bacterium]|nr:amidohydrolase family protein [Longimicrobiales bacterium]
MTSTRLASPFTALVALALLAATAPAPAAAQAEADTDTATSALREGLPLEPSHTLRTTLNEGSWLSVDVSPDGRTLVFDLLGDLYLLPIEGGTARPLTQGMAFDAQPRFSPDGSRVVFTSDRDGGENVWIMAVDGSDTIQVTRGKDNAYQSPEWTPDGEYVVATRQSSGPGKLWLWHVRGGSGVQLIREPGNLRTTGAAFAGDGRRIWMAVREGTWQYNSPMGEYQLAVYDRETGELDRRSFRYGGAFRPTLSPDGRWLVYGTRHVGQTALRVRDLRSGAEHWLAFPVQRDDQESQATRDAYPGMSFTPDSRELVATWGGKLWRVPVEGGSAREIPFQVDVALPLGPVVDFDYPIEDTETFTVKQIRDAVPSPDGRRLAFTALDRLYVMDWPDGTPRRLSGEEASVYHPAWSPDGRWLAFASWSFDDGGHIHRVRADGGGGAERLTRAGAFWQQPAWSPAGERIVALRGPARAYEEALERGAPGGTEELVWLPAGGGEATRIGPADVRQPHFTADAERIYAYAGGDGLVSFRWDGTDRKQHVRVSGGSGPGRSRSTSLILMAPRGDQALARVANDIYVVTVPRVGAEPPTIDVSDPERAAFPARLLTEVGGEFPAWGADGRTVHWSLGNAHFVYSLDAARVFEDSVEAAEAARPDTAGAPADSAAEVDAETSPEEEEEEARYRPLERRVTLTATRDIPRGTLVLRGARVITMRGQEVIEDADLVVRDNRIAAVGARGSVSVPDGAEIMDVSGRTVVPGYVDTHAHLRAAADVHRSQPWSYAANLAYGVTTVRDPQTGTTDVLTYEDRVRAGEMLGPRIYSTGPGVFSAERFRDLAHTKDVLRRYAEYFDTKTIKMYGAGNREQRQWIIEAARELRLMPTTEGGLDLKENLTMAQDGYSGIEHNLPGFPLYGDVVQLFAASKTSTTPTILVTYGGPWAENYFYATEDVLGNERLRAFTPWAEIERKALRRPGPGPGSSGWFHPDVHTFPLISDFIGDVVEAGGRAGVGSHGQLQGLGWHWELWALGSGDISAHDALRAGTILGAESLGLDRDLGSVEPGKLADLVILAADPLRDLRASDAIVGVMKNGRLYDAATLDEVWPRQIRHGPWHWQTEAGPGVAEAGLR